MPLRPVAVLAQRNDVYVLSLINAVFCMVFPVFLKMIAGKRIGAATVSQAGMVGPTFALLMAVLFQNEPVTLIQLAGTSLVPPGIYLLSQKKIRRFIWI